MGDLVLSILTIIFAPFILIGLAALVMFVSYKIIDSMILPGIQSIFTDLKESWRRIKC